MTLPNDTTIRPHQTPSMSVVEAQVETRGDTSELREFHCLPRWPVQLIASPVSSGSDDIRTIWCNLRVGGIKPMRKESLHPDAADDLLERVVGGGILAVNVPGEYAEIPTLRTHDHSASTTSDQDHIAAAMV
jgi:hypothetical protein